MLRYRWYITVMMSQPLHDVFVGLGEAREFLTLTKVLFLIVQPAARRDIVGYDHQRDDGDEDRSTTLDKEQAPPRLEMRVNEGYSIGYYSIDKATEGRHRKPECHSNAERFPRVEPRQNHLNERNKAGL